MPTYTETHDESKPAGSRALSLGDDDIRELKRAFRERLATDHEFVSDESGNDNVGYHRKATMIKRNSNPTVVSESVILFTKEDAGGDVELFAIDDDGNVIQITDDGTLDRDALEKLPNDTYYVGKDASNNDLDIFKVDTSDRFILDLVAILADGAQLATNAAPTTDAMIANKKYVDDQIASSAVGIDKIYDYGSSNSSYTEKNEGDLKICYGRAYFAAAQDKTFSGLPFSAVGTYTVVVSQNWDGVDDRPLRTYVERVSASTFTIRNTDDSDDYWVTWIAIGT